MIELIVIALVIVFGCYIFNKHTEDLEWMDRKYNKVNSRYEKYVVDDDGIVNMFKDIDIRV